MPSITVTAPNGKSLTIQGDRVPTEAELHDIFAHVGVETGAADFKASNEKDASGNATVRPSYPWQRPIEDVAIGFGKRAVQTVSDLGDLARKVPGVSALDRVMTPIPVNTTPENTAQRVGGGLEQMAEFAVPLSKVSKATAGASLLTRALAEGGASAAIGAAQSKGDPTQTAIAGGLGLAGPVAGALVRSGVKAAQRAAAGASEGGIGGAVASVVRSTSTAEPHGMLVQALKPRSTRTGFNLSLSRAVPEIKASEEALGKPIESLADLQQGIDIAKKRVRAQYDAIAGTKRAMGATVDLTPVAEAIEKSIPKTVRLEDPRKAAAILDVADKYRGRVPIEDAEQYLKETNAELDAFYNKYPMAQRKALASNPEVAHVVAKAEELRTAIYNTLDAPGQGAAARELNRRYGALMDIESEAARRANVAARQQPESLSEQIGAVRAAADAARGVWRVAHGDLTGAADIAAARAGRATATYLKEQQTTDALIKRAMASVTGRPVPVASPVAPKIAGLLGPGPIVTPPPADASFVRGVPAMRATSERLALPPGRTPIITPPPAVPESTVRSIAAAPMEHLIDPTRPVAEGGYQVHFSGDPKAVPVGLLDHPDVHAMLERMRADLDEFTPERGRLVGGRHSAGPHREDAYVHGTAGSPVGDDVRVISEQRVSNRQIREAVDELLVGKKPTNRLHTAALDAALGYLERRPGYRGPVLPGADEGFDAFSKMVDDFTADGGR
jgi:hypothetical protein